MTYIEDLDFNPFSIIKGVLKLILHNKRVFFTYGFLLTLIVFSYIGLTSFSPNFYSTLGYRFILGFLSFILVSVFLYRINAIVVGQEIPVFDIVRNIKWVKYVLTICLQYFLLFLISIPFIVIVYIMHDKLISQEFNYIPFIALLAAIFFLLPFMYYFYWVFAQVTVVIRHKYLDKALNYSKFLTRGNFWIVVYCFFIFFLFFLIPLLIFIGLRLLILLGVNKLILMFPLYERYIEMSGYLIVTFFYSILVLIPITFIVLLFLSLEKYKGIDSFSD